VDIFETLYSHRNEEQAVPMANYMKNLFPFYTWIAGANGTFTNMEGRVQRIRKAVQAPGVALADSKILGSLLARLGEKTGLQSAEDVFRALGEKVPAYKDMSYETIEKEGSMLIK
jgi:predicted molibdopterin-dependent oxidoreductase YjgC